MIDILNLGDLVGVKVKDVELIKVLKVSYPLYHVLSKHEDPEGWDRMKVSYLFDLVIVEVQENETWQRDKVLYLSDMIVLEVQKSESLLTFEEGHMRELSLV